MGAAIVGTYVLAGEIAKSPNDIRAALKRYDATTRPFVDRVQKLIPGAPQIANPQTMGFISQPFMRSFGGLVGKYSPAFGGSEWDLPDYGSAK
jgi:hypothetical protein